ncbi:MAG: SH3 domain-containing protein [Treponema sp.]|nr:SH3 domain-containing protein [Treponema sp.]
MNNFTKKIISVAFSFAVVGSVFATDISKYLRSAPNVDRAMLSADYWISKSVEPDKIIIPTEEILRLNQTVQNASLDDEGKFAYYASSKKNSRISKAKLLELMDFNFNADYYIDGAKVQQEYKDKLLELRNISALGEWNNVGYAFILRRGGLRLLPTEDILTLEEVRSFYDEMQNSSVLMNEPVIVLHQSADSLWYFVMTSYCSGWVPSSNIAFCHSYDEWNLYRNPSDFIVVSENKFRLDYDWVNDRISEVEVSMGTKLQLVPVSEYQTSYEGREAYDNYIVRIPDRSQGGYLIFHNAYIPLGKSVSVGYVPYTRRNLLKMAFSALGERYGWAGLYDARDASQFVMEIYRAFGFDLPRSTSGLIPMDAPTVDVAGMSVAHKESILKYMPSGSILLLPGFAMLYLGEVDGKYYVISSSGENIYGTSSKLTQTQGVSVYDLNTKRKNGERCVEAITKIKVMY